MDREAKMEQAGIKRLDMPANTTLLSMRGGNGLVAPAPGDDVELYVDAGNGKGEWQGGYTALSKVEAGEMGDAYDGKDIVWVGKEGQNQAYGEEPLRGMPWPVEFMRLVKGDKPTFQGALEEQPEETVTMSLRIDDAGLLRSTVLFYRPDQIRNYHGRWVDEGKGDFRSKRAMGAHVPDAIEEDTARGMASGEAQLVKLYAMINPEISNLPPDQQIKASRQYVKDNLKQLVANAGDKAAEFASWYYEVHDMTWEWAQDYNVRPEIVAGVIASLSPQTRWVGRNDRYAAEEDKVVPAEDYKRNQAGPAMLTNQILAWKVMRIIFEHGNDEITIKEEDVRRITESISEAKKYMRIDYTDYNGKDLEGFEHKNFIGTFKVNELPGDILLQILGTKGPMGDKAPLKGVMQEMGTTAIRLARGAHPDGERRMPDGSVQSNLNGPKVRSFYNNIINPDESMDNTWDVHMLRASINSLGIDKVEVNKLVGTDGAYQYMSDLLAEAAKEMGMKPHELQAAAWVQWRRQTGGQSGTAKAANARRKKEAANG